MEFSQIKRVPEIIESILEIIKSFPVKAEKKLFSIEVASALIRLSILRHVYLLELLWITSFQAKDITLNPFASLNISKKPKKFYFQLYPKTNPKPSKNV